MGYCAHLCRAVDTELSKAQRVAAATADTAYWSAATALNAALDEYLSHDHRLFLGVRQRGGLSEWINMREGVSG